MATLRQVTACAGRTKDQAFDFCLTQCTSSQLLYPDSESVVERSLL